ncbi:hypothetical protein [Povalibacter sp.]|uniref:hypothetical protein n=1 Tax=Povalibacter sp. TaxID=1962978 RepID=UPI002F3ED10F
MRQWIAGAVLAGVVTVGEAQEACDGVRIDYEASVPSINAPMGPWSEVLRNFPEARGITSRIVYATPQRLIDIQRGVGIKATVSKDMLAPAPGVHFRDASGRPILWVGYRQVPLHFMTIKSATERISYSSVTGEARRIAVDAPDRDMTAMLLAMEGTAETIGDREYAGVRCVAKRIPMQGPRTETCVRSYHGWPIALYLQIDMPEAGGLQWFRANRIDEHACMRGSEVAIPADAKMIDKRGRATD